MMIIILCRYDFMILLVLYNIRITFELAGASVHVVVDRYFDVRKVNGDEFPIQINTFSISKPNRTRARAIQIYILLYVGISTT